MAVKLPDGKIARTQPEQVKKNMDDIESIKSELDIVKEGIASAYKIQGSSEVADLNALEKDEELNGYVYNMLDAGNLVNEDASTLSVQIGDNVVFVWNGGDWYWDRLAGLVDTSNLCTLDTDQNISGIKTFQNGAKFSAFGGTTGTSIYGDTSSIFPEGNGSKNLGLTNRRWKDIFLNGAVKFDYTSSTGKWSIAQDGTNQMSVYQDSAQKYCFQGGQFFNLVNADLGNSSRNWKDLYLSGKIINSGFIVNNGSADVFKVDGVNGECKTLYTIQPFTDNGCSLGKSNVRFNNVYTGVVENDYGTVNIISSTEVRLTYGSGNKYVLATRLPQKLFFLQATHAPSTSGAITVETFTLTAEQQALIDTSAPIYLVAAQNANEATDVCMGFVYYNSSTGVISYLNYGQTYTITYFYVFQ